MCCRWHTGTVTGSGGGVKDGRKVCIARMGVGWAWGNRSRAVMQLQGTPEAVRVGMQEVGKLNSNCPLMCMFLMLAQSSELALESMEVGACGQVCQGRLSEVAECSATFAIKPTFMIF